MTIARISLALCACAVVIAGCSAEEADVTKAAAQAASARSAVVDPSYYSGEFEIMFSADLPTRLGALPFTVFAGLDAASDTRLGIKAFADLRAIQARLPELLSGTLEQSCSQDISLDVSKVTANGERIIAEGLVNARIYRCRQGGTPEEERGIRLISQRVETTVVATAVVSDDCIEFGLVDLQLSPSGLLGSIANLFGVTDRIQTAIIGRGEEILSENPLCPKLPPELSSLAPRYDAGGPREIGGGAMGAALIGSVDASSNTLIELLSLAQDRRIVEDRR